MATNEQRTLEEEAVTQPDVLVEASFNAQADRWLEELHLLAKDSTMSSPVQNIAVSMLSGVLLTATPTVAGAAQKYAVGICQVQSKDLVQDIYPLFDASGYIYNYLRDNPKFKSIDVDKYLSEFKEEATTTMLSLPSLGKIEIEKKSYGGASWRYIRTATSEDDGYVGQDHFIVKVEYKDISIFVHYYIEVVGNSPTTYIGDGDERYSHFCQIETWKISKGSPTLFTDQPLGLGSTSLSTRLSSAGSVFQGFQGLSGAATGSTEGQGAAARITLDVKTLLIKG